VAKINKPTGKEYSFVTVEEIVKTLTLEQVDAFTEDFRTWLKLQKGDYSVDPTMKMVSVIAGLFAKMNGDKLSDVMAPSTDHWKSFQWKDDGIRGVSKIGFMPMNEKDFKKKTKS
jgi:hypothetical protein